MVTAARQEIEGVQRLRRKVVENSSRFYSGIYEE